MRNIKLFFLFFGGSILFWLGRCFFPSFFFFFFSLSLSPPLSPCSSLDVIFSAQTFSGVVFIWYSFAVSFTLLFIYLLKNALFMHWNANEISEFANDSVWSGQKQGKTKTHKNETRKEKKIEKITISIRFVWDERPIEVRDCSLSSLPPKSKWNI